MQGHSSRLHRASRCEALLLRDELLRRRRAEHRRSLQRQAVPTELIQHVHFLSFEARGPHGVAIHMRQGVDDASVVPVRRDAEAQRPLHPHDLIQKLILEIHVSPSEVRRARRLLDPVHLEVIEVQGRRLSNFFGGNAQPGPSPQHVQLELAELIRRDHLGSDRRSRPPDLVAGQMCRRVDDSLAVLVDRVAELIGLEDLHGPRLELIGQRHIVLLESRLALRLPRLVAEEVVDRGSRWRRSCRGRRCRRCRRCRCGCR